MTIDMIRERKVITQTNMTITRREIDQIWEAMELKDAMHWWKRNDLDGLDLYLEEVDIISAFNESDRLH